MRIARRLLVSLIAVNGCAAATEQATLTEFFAASRLRDTTALKNIATVVFEPATQGIITGFEITDVAPGRNDGELRSEVVSITAPVKLPGGQTAQQKLVVTMQRSAGHWIVTGITGAPPRESPSPQRP